MGMKRIEFLRSLLGLPFISVIAEHLSAKTLTLEIENGKRYWCGIEVNSTAPKCGPSVVEDFYFDCTKTHDDYKLSAEFEGMESSCKGFGEYEGGY